MTDLFWVDGRLGARVPPDDRGLALADGVFETLRVEQGEICCLRLHRERLAKGLEVLQFTDPSHRAEMALATATACLTAATDNASGTLRLSVTRGSSARGYAIPSDVVPRTIVRYSPGLAEVSARARVTVAAVAWSEQPAYQGCKLLCRTEQVMALAGARDAGFDDVVMPAPDGSWQSTGSGNLFLRFGDLLVTAPVGAAGIAGTRRHAIIHYWGEQMGYQVSVAPISCGEAAGADEAFYCNAVVGVRGIESIDQLRFEEHGAADRLAGVIHQDWLR